MNRPKRASAKRKSPSSLAIRPVTAGDWAAVEALFGSNGACGGCWCMWWRVEKGGATWDAARGEPNRRALRNLIGSARCQAMLAFDGDRPVGWCSFGPKSDFPRLARSRKLARPDPAPWTVNCFFIDRDYRRRGLSRRLLEAAAAAAFAAGATAIEGYPVKVAGGAVPAAFAWTGVPAIFRAAGFTEVDHDAGARRIYERRAPRRRRS